MADWTTIPDDVLEPGKPIRSVDALALRDNPVAIAAGAAGAPRVQTAAIQNGAVTNAKLANSSVTTAKLADANVTTAKLANANVTSAKLATGERMTTANVLARTAGASLGAVGTYAFLGTSLTTAGAVIIENTTYAGSDLRYFGANVGTGTGTFNSGTRIGGTPPGTWRAMGHVRDGSSGRRATTLFLRIS